MKDEKKHLRGKKSIKALEGRKPSHTGDDKSIYIEANDTLQ